MKIKNIFRVVILGLLFFSYYVGAAPVKLDKIVAVVNSDVITQNELDKKIAFMKKRGDVSESGALSSRQKALDELIDISLQLQLAKRSGIQVSDRELDGMIANMAKNNGLTVAQLKAAIVEKEGISFSDFRKQIREQGLISRVQHQFLGRELDVSEKEIEEALRHPPKIDRSPAEYHVIDILFAMVDDTPADQKAIITKVANKMAIRLKQGASVESVVEDGQRSLKEQIIQSNDLGWRKIDEFPELFVKEIAKMKAKQVAGPLSAPNGLHLLKVLEIRGPMPQAAKFTREQATEMLYYRKLVEKLKPWLEELRAKAYIKITK